MEDYTKIKKQLDGESTDKYEVYKKYLEEAIELSQDVDQHYTLSADIQDGKVVKIFWSKRDSKSLNTYE